MPLRSIASVKKMAGKRVLVRIDANVPIKQGKVLDDFRLARTLPTLQFLSEHGARVIVVSHLGRPHGVESKLSLRPIQKWLATHWQKVPLLPIVEKFQWQRTVTAIEKMKNGQAVLLENIRFLPGEEKNTRALRKTLASVADIFVLDGFAVAHRASASVSGVARYLPSYAGLLLYEEVTTIAKAIKKPKRPFVVVLGGAKIETKLPIIQELLPRADHILVGGGIANTLLAARKGNHLGLSIIDRSYRKKIMDLAKNKKIIFPVDAVVGREDGKHARIVSTLEPITLPADEGLFDTGPATIALYAGFIKKAGTLLMNGALGYFEQHPYEYGTRAVTRLVAARSKGKAFGIIGGGETVELAAHLGVLDDIDLVSTGGGALLEFLAGKTLPGIAALESHPRTFGDHWRSFFKR